MLFVRKIEFSFVLTLLLLSPLYLSGGSYYKVFGTSSTSIRAIFLNNQSVVINSYNSDNKLILLSLSLQTLKTNSLLQLKSATVVTDYYSNNEEDNSNYYDYLIKNQNRYYLFNDFRKGFLILDSSFKLIENKQAPQKGKISSPIFADNTLISNTVNEFGRFILFLNESSEKYISDTKFGINNNDTILFTTVPSYAKAGKIIFYIQETNIKKQTTKMKFLTYDLQDSNNYFFDEPTYKSDYQLLSVPYFIHNKIFIKEFYSDKINLDIFAAIQVSKDSLKSFQRTLLYHDWTKNLNIRGMEGGNDSTIIAFGNNSSIFISTNDGETWEIDSLIGELKYANITQGIHMGDNKFLLLVQGIGREGYIVIYDPFGTTSIEAEQTTNTNLTQSTQIELFDILGRSIAIFQSYEELKANIDSYTPPHLVKWRDSGGIYHFEKMK